MTSNNKNAFLKSILLIQLLIFSCQNKEKKIVPTEKVKNQRSEQHILQQKEISGREEDSLILSSLPYLEEDKGKYTLPNNLVSHKRIHSQKKETTLKKRELLPLVNYFNFDRAEHYSIQIEYKDISTIQTEEQKSQNENLLINILESYEPLNLKDIHFLEKLESLGFSKKQIDQKKLDKLNNLFSSKKHHKVYSMGCSPVFRDIIVFKNRSKIVGIAKVCFQCIKSHIVGTNVNTSSFGQSGDYSKLAILLNQ